LHEVDFIVIQKDSLSSLIEKVHPDRVLTLGKEGFSEKVSHPKELITS